MTRKVLARADKNADILGRLLIEVRLAREKAAEETARSQRLAAIVRDFKQLPKVR